MLKLNSKSKEELSVKLNYRKKTLLRSFNSKLRRSKFTTVAIVRKKRNKNKARKRSNRNLLLSKSIQKKALTKK